MPLSKAFRSRVLFTVEYLVVGGGGSGIGIAGVPGGGGGGAEVLSGALLIEALRSFPIVIGVGADVVHGPITATASSVFGVTARPGKNGGGTDQSQSQLGGASGNGNAGGTPNAQGGGGGGGAGGPASSNNGGPGVASVFTGTSVAYGAGGGAGKGDGGPGGAGGSGVGGNGAGDTGSTQPTTPGSAGGGGVSSLPPSFGRNGIVAIRYAGTAIRATGGTVTQISGYVLHTFTSNGSFATI